jgi:hypothetical protein
VFSLRSVPWLYISDNKAASASGGNIKLQQKAQHFGGIYPLHLLGWRVSQIRNQRKQLSLSASAGFLLGLFFHHEDEDMFLRTMWCYNQGDHTLQHAGFSFFIDKI